ncbi:MAG TPA: discoidin domain-containing protein [Thermoanaerobaculia bacterium]|nr:discoidin domain-containing protein [Thermoanaerobaculia bacterium]
MKKLALLACLLIACGERSAGFSPPREDGLKPVLHIEPDTDAENLLNLAYGAAVVSRTGELNLELSAVHAIDGISTTAWISSPGAPDETLVYSLLSPSRLKRVGVTVSVGDQVPRGLAFDASMDGKTWRELISVEPQKHNERQLWPVPETVARYVRIRSLDREKYYVRARAFHVLGDEVAPPDTPPFGGCWTINGQRASLQQDGARITGTIESEPPTYLEGGTDNRVAMLTWQQGATWGHAVLTRTPDGRHLTGLRFFTEFEIKWLGDAWYGDKCRAGFSPPLSSGGGGLKPALHLATYPLYGLAFDSKGQVIEELSKAQLDAVVPLLAGRRARITSYEVRYDTAEDNRRVTAARVASLRAALQARGVDVSRIEFVAAGNNWQGPILRSTIQRLLASRVELSFGT